MLDLVEPLIIDSARKHGITDDDMLDAFNHSMRYRDLDDGFVLMIGTPRSAQLLEIGYVERTDGPVIVHAMPAPRKYLR